MLTAKWDLVPMVYAEFLSLKSQGESASARTVIERGNFAVP